MARPKNLPIIDLMLELPTGDAGMGMDAARKLTKGDDGFSHHPAQYMFKDAPAEMGKTRSAEEIVAMMDAFGVRAAFIGVDARKPDHAIALFEKFPGRFFGEVNVNPHAGMKGVRALEACIKAHPAMKAAFAAACLLNPQVPLDDKTFYPIYAKCVELDIPINVLVGVPGPRVPYKCQHPGLLDEICWFFPELKVVMRHGGEPWTDLCAKLMLKWPNLYYATSAFAPKYYPKAIIDFANTRGAQKVMFAGYYPALSYQRIFDELDDVPFKPDVWGGFLGANAARLYRLDPA